MKKNFEISLNNSFVAHLWSVSKEKLTDETTGFRSPSGELVLTYNEDWAKQNGITIQEFNPRPNPPRPESESSAFIKPC